FQAEDGIRYRTVTGVQTCALPICERVERGRAHRDLGGRQMGAQVARRQDRTEGPSRVAERSRKTAAVQPDGRAIRQRHELRGREIGRAAWRGSVGSLYGLSAV